MIAASELGALARRPAMRIPTRDECAILNAIAYARDVHAMPSAYSATTPSARACLRCAFEGWLTGTFRDGMFTFEVTRAGRAALGRAQAP